MKKENQEDLELVKKAQKGDLTAQEALLMKYAWIARSKARNYFLEGGSRDDIVQEGMLGLWKAIREFDEKKNDTFVAFANMCVLSHIHDAIKAHNRFKNKMLNESVSLTAFDDNEEPADMPTEYVSDPVSYYIEKEGVENFYSKINAICTPEQLEVLKYYFEGYTYVEIAKLLNKPPKKIDNILTAIKTKIRKNKELFIE